MLTPILCDDHESLSRAAADWLADEARRRPTGLWCLATGATPMRTYERLAERWSAAPAEGSQLRFVKLDEWGGLAPDDPATCEHALQTTLIAPLGLQDRYTGFHSRPADPLAEIARQQTWLQQNGPFTLCVLGLGLNGHLGFNEPAASLPPHAHLAELSSTSLTHSMLQSTDDRPHYGLTFGLADLFAAPRILLLVSGAAKRAAVARLLGGPLATEFPASLLHLHPGVHLMCTRDCLSSPELS